MTKRFHITTSDREIRDLLPTHPVLAEDLEIGDHVHDDMITWTVDKKTINPDGTINFYDVNNCGHVNERPESVYDVLDPYCVSNGDRLPTYAELAAMLRECRPVVWRAMMGGKSPHVQDKLDAESLWPKLDKAIKDAVTPE
jgi:hypothetical protein